MTINTANDDIRATIYAEAPSKTHVVSLCERHDVANINTATRAELESMLSEIRAAKGPRVTPDALVAREVFHVASGLVHSLASAYGVADVDGLAEQAFELSTPVPDYDAAAQEADWYVEDGKWTRAAYIEEEDECPYADTAEGACEIDGLGPLDREVFEHWIISDWLADKLEERGEKVDRDFAGLTIWARTTTGQAIAMDGVIEDVCAALNAA